MTHVHLNPNLIFIELIINQHRNESNMSKVGLTTRLLNVYFSKLNMPNYYL